LVVEDDVDLRTSLCEILEQEGYATIQAQNGREALTQLRSAVRPCCILLDLMMPVMTGPQFRAEQITDPVLAKIPVVVFSALEDGQQRNLIADAAAYVKKPVEIEALLRTIAAVCEAGRNV
jgi:CheY-like chemotaxis protein